MDKLERGRWFWRVVDVEKNEMSATWRVVIDPRSSQEARQGVLHASDFNGDGFDDFIEQQAVFFGRRELSADGTKSTAIGPGGEVQCTPPMADFGKQGRCVNLARPLPLGDVDGDGYDDLLVFADHKMLHYGGRRGMPFDRVWTPSADKTRDLPVPAESALRLGDVNGDGFADLGLVVKGELLVYAGGVAGLSDTAMSTLPAGRNWAGGGDLDGDGYCDIVAMRTEGIVVVHRGGPSGPAPGDKREVRLPSPMQPVDAPDLSESPAVRIEDVDGDGRGDVVGVSLFAGAGKRPSLWELPGAGVLSLSAVPHVRPWSLPRCCEAGFTWDLVRSSRAASGVQMVVADRQEFAREIVRVSFSRDGDFSVPASVRRDKDMTVSSRAPEAVGDINGDGYEDLLIRAVADIDGGRLGLLFLGDPSGIRYPGAHYQIGGGDDSYVTNPLDYQPVNCVDAPSTACDR